MSYASPASVCPDTTNLEKLVQTIAYGLPALGKEGLIAANTKEGSLRGDALSQKNDTARLFVQCLEILAGWFVTDLAICLAADEGKISDVVCFPRCIAILEDSLGKDVVKLEKMLRTPMS